MPKRSGGRRQDKGKSEQADQQVGLPWHAPEEAGKLVEILIGTDVGVSCRLEDEEEFIRLRADVDRIASPTVKQASQTLRTAVCQLAALQGDDVEFGTELIYKKGGATLLRQWYLRLPGRCRALVASPELQAHVRDFSVAVGDLDAAELRPASEAGDHHNAMLVLAKALQSSMIGARYFPENTTIRCSEWAEQIALPKTVADAPKVEEAEKSDELLVRVTGSDWHAREVHLLPEKRQVHVTMSYDQNIFEHIVEDARQKRRNQYRAKFTIELKGGKPQRFVLKDLVLHMEDFFQDHLAEAMEESADEE